MGKDYKFGNRYEYAPAPVTPSMEITINQVRYNFYPDHYYRIFKSIII